MARSLTLMDEDEVFLEAFTSGELLVYRYWWVTGEGYEANRELIDRMEAFRLRELEG
jgi:hypothetical protein